LTFFNDQNLEEAIISFTNAISIDSTFSQAFLFRGKCYEGSNDNLAILDYKIVYSLDSSNFSPLYEMARVQSKIDVNEAIGIYNFIISSSDQQSRAYYELGVLSYLNKDFTEAIKYFTNSITISEDARTYNDRASCYRMINDNELAINDYITAISIDSDLAFIYNNLASIYRKKGDSVQALNYYTLAISKDQDYVLAYNNRGSLYISFNDIDKALNDIEKAISIDKDYAPTYNNKGVIFHKQEKYLEALFYFDKAISLNNYYGKAYLNRGITKQIKRDEDGACDDWLRAKQLGINVAKKYLDHDCN
jgi:tetratricopeptide (TPR) repeat protein